MADISNSKKVALEYTLKNQLAIIWRLFFSIPRRIVYASVLGLTGYAFLEIIRLIRTFSTYVNFGVNTSFSRQLSISLGSNNLEEKDNLLKVNFIWSLINISFVLLVLWTLFLLDYNFYGFLNLINLSLLSLILSLEIYVSFCKHLAKSLGEFNLIGNTEIYTSFLSPVMLIGLVYYYGITGFLSGTLFLNLVQFFIYTKNLFEHLFKLPSYNLFFSKIYTYIAHGIPLWAATSSKSFFLVLGSSLIAFIYDSDSLGEYSFALGILSFGLSLGFAIEHVISRQMLFKKGEKSNTRALKSNIKNYMGSPLLIYLLYLNIIFGSLYFSFIFLVKNFVESFNSSIEIFEILMFGYLFYIIAVFTTHILNVFDKQMLRIQIFLVGILLQIILSLILIKLNFGFKAIAYSFSISSFFVSSIFIYYSFKQFNNDLAWLHFLLKYLFCTSVVYLAMILFGMIDLNLYEIYFHSEIITNIFNMFFQITFFTITIIGLYFVIYYKQNPVGEAFRMLKYTLTLRSRRTPASKKYS